MAEGPGEEKTPREDVGSATSRTSPVRTFSLRMIERHVKLIGPADAGANWSL